MTNSLSAPDDLGNLAVDINESHRSYLECSRNAVGYAVEAGEALARAKKIVGHGGFEQWVRKFTKVSPRSARVYMQVARRWSELTQAKRQQTADLTLRDALAELASTSKKLAALPALDADKAIADARDHTVKRSVDSAVAEQKKAARWLHVPGGILREAAPASPVIEGKAEEVSPPPRRHQLLVAHILQAVRTYVSEIDAELSAEDACEALNEAYCKIQEDGEAVLRPMAKAKAEEEELALAVGSLLRRFREVSQKISAADLYEQFPAKLRHNLDIALTDAHRFVDGLHSAWNEQRGERP